MLGFVPPPGFTPSDPNSPFQFLSANPARIGLFPAGPVPPTVPPGNCRMTISGADLRGETTLIVLRGSAGVGAAAPTERSFRVDTGSPANPDWSFAVSGTEIGVSPHQAVQDDQGVALTIYPGLFSLQVVTSRQIPGAAGGRRVEHSSNEVIFALVPQVISIAGMGGPVNARQFRITIFGTYLRNELDIQLSVAGSVLRRNANTAVAGNYNFAVNTGVIDFAIDTTSRSSPLPVNLMINGAGSTPAWAVF